jgi:hypothetical protein
MILLGVIALTADRLGRSNRHRILVLVLDSLLSARAYSPTCERIDRVTA